MTSAELIEVRHLSKTFGRKARSVVHAVDDVSFDIAFGETLALVGETGSGKSTTARLLLLLEKATSGEILFEGKGVANFSRSEIWRYRAATQAVFQDPWSSLNPRMRAESIVSEPLRARRGSDRQDALRRAHRLMDDVGLPASSYRKYPHEFSGGQRQRIAIARALAPSPRLIILDEPLSSLDVSIQGQVMQLLKSLQDEHGVSYLLISHQMAAVRHLAHRVCVMYLGKIVEQGSMDAVLRAPQHPYTQALMSAVLPADPNSTRKEIVLKGEIPSAIHRPAGCAFHPRCPVALEQCSTEMPGMRVSAESRRIACHLF